MKLNWRAIGVAFVVTIILGLLSGLTIPYTEMALPALSHGIIGLVGGLVAGYMVGGPTTRGAIHGAIGTSVGAIVFALLLTLTGIVTLGLVGMGLAGFVVLALIVVMIPGAIGGGLGSLLKQRSASTKRAPTA